MNSATRPEAPVADNEERDYYLEGDYVVFTRGYHLKRGWCCGSGCRHCPYSPRATRGSTTIAPKPPDKQT